MLSLSTLRRLAAVLLASAVCMPAAAADRCQPVAVLDPDDPLEVGAEEAAGPVSLEARTTAPFSVLAAGRASMLEGGRLARDLRLTDVVLGRGVIAGDAATLKVDGGGDVLVLRTPSQRVMARIAGHEVRTVQGRPLRVSPNLDAATPFTVAAGSPARIADGLLTFGAGTTLVWHAEAGKPLKMYLLEGVQLARTAPAGTGHLVRAVPDRALTGGRLSMQVAASGLDLRANPPAFCLAGKGGTIALDAQFERQDGDVASFNLRLPVDGLRALREGATWFDRIVGVKAALQAIAYGANGAVALDQRVDVRLSSVRWSAAIGVGVLVLLYVLCAVLLRERRPLRIAAHFIRQPNGRLSLSNLQVLLWTLLVVFALAFAWAGTSQLLPLSNGVLLLLGIAGGSSVLARTVESVNPAVANRRPGKGESRELVTDPDGNFDLLRFQMLAFTVFALVYSLWSVLRSDGIPDLPESIYWLMGLTNGTYVAGKLPALFAPAEAPRAAAVSVPAAPAEEGLAREQVERLQKALHVPATGTLDEGTRAAVERYKQANGLYPVNGQVSRALLLHAGAAAPA